MGEKFVSCDLDDIHIGVPLPVSVFVYLDFRFITFRAAGDVMDRATYDRLEFKKVRNLFVTEQDAKVFEAWSVQRKAEKTLNEPEKAPEFEELRRVRLDAHRRMLDIFQSEHPDKLISQAIEASRKIVDEIMKFPFAVKPLSQLQTFSQGTVDHSVNVAILSVYLAIQMGYAHNLILQHLALGALLHDVGKAKVPFMDEDSPDVIEQKLREHPTLGVEIFENQAKVPNEVKMIIAQHHESFDGSGYPKKLRGNNIYDLTRIVTIANEFDEAVGNGDGTLAQRQKEAVRRLDEELYKRFDPQKLEKALKVLRMGV